jgi:hypothetical protein
MDWFPVPIFPWTNPLNIDPNQQPLHDGASDFWAPRFDLFDVLDADLSGELEFDVPWTSLDCVQPKSQWIAIGFYIYI